MREAKSANRGRLIVGLHDKKNAFVMTNEIIELLQRPHLAAVPFALDMWIALLSYFSKVHSNRSRSAPLTIPAHAEACKAEFYSKLLLHA
jgi:hypothetical protein